MFLSYADAGNRTERRANDLSLGRKPMTVSVAMLATALDPELVSSFSDGLFKVLHRFILFELKRRADGHHAADPPVRLPASGSRLQVPSAPQHAT
jgi:hypothetical protein